MVSDLVEVLKGTDSSSNRLYCVEDSRNQEFDLLDVLLTYITRYQIVIAGPNANKPVRPNLSEKRKWRGTSTSSSSYEVES